MDIGRPAPADEQRSGRAAWPAPDRGLPDGDRDYQEPPTQPPGLPEPTPIVQLRVTVPPALRVIENVSPVEFEVELTV